MNNSYEINQEKEWQEEEKREKGKIILTWINNAAMTCHIKHNGKKHDNRGRQNKYVKLAWHYHLMLSIWMTLMEGFHQVQHFNFWKFSAFFRLRSYVKDTRNTVLNLYTIIPLHGKTRFTAWKPAYHIYIEQGLYQDWVDINAYKQVHRQVSLSLS
jgi:hypothetical protein